MIDVSSFACPACGGVEFTQHQGLTMRLGGKVIVLPSIRTRACRVCEKESMMPDDAEKIEALAEMVGYKGELL